MEYGTVLVETEEEMKKSSQANTILFVRADSFANKLEHKTYEKTLNRAQANLKKSNELQNVTSSCLSTLTNHALLLIPFRVSLHRIEMPRFVIRSLITSLNSLVK